MAHFPSCETASNLTPRLHCASVNVLCFASPLEVFTSNRSVAPSLIATAIRSIGPVAHTFQNTQYPRDISHALATN
jgi:hypothetical protein